MSDKTEKQSLPDNEFRDLLSEAIPYMRAFARGLTGEKASADDLAQDAMLRAWDRRQQFASGSNFKAWVFTIIRNQFYSDRRRAWRQVQLDEEKAKQTLSSGLDLDGVMDLDDVRRAIKELSEDQREALMLVGAGGFSYEEAAEICGCAVGTVKSRVSRARTALADILQRRPKHAAGEDGITAFDALETMVRDVETLSGKREIA
ncbi:sigma-70 family RNA polymerase sigma factor [Woodsholea maritima]|uniref:sigma-70 family RNA polymerase sigma factor n=1 Tax=Woodsholea maritima TaxID=240237 RepID=UPI00037105F1|nr:sigma-70 family RNA polymerase sigma factor [Woodsholea maritima]